MVCWSRFQLNYSYAAFHSMHAPLGWLFRCHTHMLVVQIDIIHTRCDSYVDPSVDARSDAPLERFTGQRVV